MTETKKTIKVSLVFMEDNVEPETDLRKRILRKSFSLFLSRGFSRVTTQDISAALGISKKTLYKYFESKRDIVNTAIDENLQGIDSRAEAIMNHQEWDFSKKFSQLIMLVHKQVSSISMVFLEDMSRRIPEVWQKIDTFRRERIFTCLKQLLKSGQAEGAVRKDLDLDALLYILFGMINSGVTPEHLLKSGHSLSTILTTLLEVFYKGLLTPQAAKTVDIKNNLMQAKEFRNEEKFFID